MTRNDASLQRFRRKVLCCSTYFFPKYENSFNLKKRRGQKGRYPPHFQPCALYECFQVHSLRGDCYGKTLSSIFQWVSRIKSRTFHRGIVTDKYMMIERWIFLHQRAKLATGKWKKSAIRLTTGTLVLYIKARNGFGTSINAKLSSQGLSPNILSFQTLIGCPGE